MNEFQWYLAQVRPNQGQRAILNLRRQDFRVFMPNLEKTTRLRNRIVKRPEPLFPGYLFVHCDCARPRWSVISATYGVSRLVALDARGPTPVPLHIIDGLMQDCDAEGMIRPPQDLQPGDHVRLCSGIFFGRTGTVEALSDQERIYVLLDCMGRSVRMSVPRSELRRVPARLTQ